MHRPYPLTNIAKPEMPAIAYMPELFLALRPLRSCIMLDVMQFAAPPRKRRPRHEPPLTSGAVAQLVGCHPITVRRAIDRGELRATRLGPRGTFRIERVAIEAWLHPTIDNEEKTRASL